MRRGKYILIGLDRGGVLIHLGMSGSIRVLKEVPAPSAHDHFDLYSSSGHLIRYRDPRRFGCLLWHPTNIHAHPRLKSLGVEPLESEFDGQLLYRVAKQRRVPVKTLIMDGQVVVGVGNIYASESLFDAGIHPLRLCHRIAAKRYQRLALSIRKILREAIAKGGTTLKDFVNIEGNPGYFEQKLSVYGREHAACCRCHTLIRKVVVGQRSTYYCPKCQT